MGGQIREEPQTGGGDELTFKLKSDLPANVIPKESCLNLARSLELKRFLRNDKFFCIDDLDCLCFLNCSL